jgi:hypothetical protein
MAGYINSSRIDLVTIPPTMGAAMRFMTSDPAPLGPLEISLSAGRVAQRNFAAYETGYVAVNSTLSIVR